MKFQIGLGLLLIGTLVVMLLPLCFPEYLQLHYFPLSETPVEEVEKLHSPIKNICWYVDDCEDRVVK